MTKHGACAWYAVQLSLHIHSEYLILISFPRQQLLHVRPSFLRFYVTCRFLFTISECTNKCVPEPDAHIQNSFDRPHTRSLVDYTVRIIRGSYRRS